MVANVRETIDLEGYLTTRVAVLNERGGHGYDLGVRTFACPFCGDTKGRGWLNVVRWTAGCWNAGCPAEPRLEGGAVAWVQQVEGFGTRARTWTKLLKEFRGTPVAAVRPLLGQETVDWVRFPAEYCRLPGEGGRAGMQAMAWLVAHWGLTAPDVARWELGYCARGPYAWRVILPVIMSGIVVGFQARTIREAAPKYRTSSFGGECGRPASAMLFGYDATMRGGAVLLVEGAGDVMGWHRGGAILRQPRAIGLLGVALTSAKLALLAALAPSTVVVALDAEPAAQQRARAHAEDLEAWGLPVELGTWVGGKDAGSGATLVRTSLSQGARALVERRLGIG